MSEPAAPKPTECLNCGTPLSGPFCAACGQRNIPPYPTLRELVVDAFSELSGWDGRFAVTVRTLVRRPGMLTREFLEGRRARYISPLRLYIVASLAYFLLAAAAPHLHPPDRREVDVAGVRVRVDTRDAPASRAERVGNAARASLDAADGDELTTEEKAEALRQAERAPAMVRPLLRRSIEDPDGLKRGMLNALPRMFFVLLPLFAAIVALFYRGRRYPEHLYFAVHLHAFVFLILAVPELILFTRSQTLADAVGIVATLAIPVYATLAFRRVYGDSLARTIAKEVGIGLIYSVVAFVALVVTTYWVSVVR
jgi:Protein of unknown function (DUF3667)